MLTYLPRRAELSRGIASGRPPLWNPYILSGTPFFADPQSRVLYPLALLLVPFGAEKALGYDVALHFLLALIGMYLFLTAIDASRAGATLGAFAYGFSSFFATRMGHPTFVASAAWIPFFFYGFELARRSERVGTLLLGAFFVMGYLAGFPQVLVFGVAALVLYAVVLAVDEAVRGPRRAGLAHAAASARIVGVAGGLALLVVAAQLVPFREFLRNSEGVGISLDQMKLLHLSKPVVLLRALVPGLFGNPVEGTNWVPLVQHGIHPYNLGLVVYCGVGTLAIALGGLAFLGQSKHLRALAAILILSVAIGTSGPVLGMAYRAIPLFRYSQIDRISVLACFALAAIAGKGLSLFAISPSRRSRAVFLAAAGAVVASLVAGLLIFAIRGEALLASLRPTTLSGGPYVDAGAERVAAWSAGRLDLWVAYERGQIVRALVFGAATFGLLAVLARSRGRTARAAAALCAVVVGVVGADCFTAARSYYVSQPGGRLAATEGIKTLASLVGTKGEWRTFNQEGATWVFPPNANELFGIEALRGRSTLVPRTYAHCLGSGGPAMMNGRLGSLEGSEPGLEVLGLMSARYLIRSSFDPAFASGIFGGIARQPGAISAIRMPALGGEARVALCQAAGDTLSLGIFVPPRARLDFFVGVPSTGGGVTLELTCETPAGRVRFRKDVDPSGGGCWYDESLDLSSLGGQYPRLTLTAIASGSHVAAGPAAGAAAEGGAQGAAGVPVVAWGGFEMVLADCQAQPMERGYAVRTDSAGIVSLTLSSGARDVPLEITSEAGRSLRWIAFPSYLKHRTIGIDMTEISGGVLTVTSDSAFTLEGSRLGRKSSSVAWGDLVYAGDMYIFENAAAIEKALVVPGKGMRALFEVGRAGVRHPGAPPDVRCGKVRVLSYEPEKIEMEAVADRDAWLVVEDSFYPGWKAFVDGAERAILMTDVGTRAVEIGKGNHRVVMEFKPGSLKLGVFLTALGLLAGVLYAITPRRTARK